MELTEQERVLLLYIGAAIIWSQRGNADFDLPEALKKARALLDLVLASQSIPHRSNK